VRYIGASNYSGSRLAEALETSRKNNLTSYVSLQPHYNLVEREKFETDLLPVVQKYQLGVIPYFSLAAGFLTGKYRSKQDAEKAARRHGAEIYERQRIRRDCGAEYGRQCQRLNPSARSPRLAHLSAWRHRSHRQRDQ
jgi:aryl-alcohol dehydrogenase-like predicted oxidoreductase